MERCSDQPWNVIITKFQFLSSFPFIGRLLHEEILSERRTELFDKFNPPSSVTIYARMLSNTDLTSHHRLWPLCHLGSVISGFLKLYGIEVMSTADNVMSFSDCGRFHLESRTTNQNWNKMKNTVDNI